MSCGSINIHPFRSGHNLDSNDHDTDLLSGSGYHVVNHADLKQSTYESLNPCRYDASLGADDTDGCSQTSSQDSVSDLSQDALTSSPISASSDDQSSESQHDLSSRHHWTRTTDLNYRGSWNESDSDSENIAFGTNSSEGGAQLRHVLHQPSATVSDACGFPGFTNVPYRFKDDHNTSKSQKSASLSGLVQHNQLSASVSGPLVPLPQGNRRRGCPTGPPACPPKLRRDTENTDAIVKMIVIFCTNLIGSIWNTSAAYEASTSAHTGSNVLPLQIFITETLRRSKTSYSTLQVALYYLIILKQCLSAGQQQRSSNQSGCRAMQCGRRMFLTALILASKYLQDRNYSARAWSKISGLPLKEINENERNYLAIVGWDLHVPKDTFENWSKIVLSICRLSTEQDSAANGSDSQLSNSGMPAGFSQRCQLQNMCRDASALRGWWSLNLRGLCTEVVRSCQKTEQYLLSVSPFRDGLSLPKPMLAPTPRSESPESSSFSDNDSTPKALPRMPNLDRTSQPFQPTDRIDSPAATLSMPPPPMLRNLPTPQTTPRSDMTNIWTPQLPKSSLRCKASASALSSLGRSYQSLANLDVCPSSALKNCAINKFRPWSVSATSASSQAVDHSATSSPESVVSDNWSFVGRSRSSSISSTSSFLTASSSTTNSTIESDGIERMRRDYAAMQQQQQQQYLDSRPRNIHQQRPWLARDQIDRPRTAFRISDITSGQCDTSVPAHGARHVGDAERQNRSSNDHDLEKDERDAIFGLVAIKSSDHANPATTRLGPVRFNTSICTPTGLGSNKTHILKRSRSETLDLTRDSIAALYGPEPNNTSNVCPRTQTWNEDLSKCLTNPCQSYATPRKPVPCGTHNKRLAVQTPSLAVNMATSHLRRDITVT